MSKDADTWARIAFEISAASAVIKCPHCGEPTIKVPNQRICSTTAQVVQEVKKK